MCEREECATGRDPHRAKVSDQFFLEHPASLDEQTTVDGFMGHVHVLIVRKLTLEPTRYLLRRPIQYQLLGDHTS